MNQVTPVALSNWQNFYVILGSSAGALTGLQFVVITLVTQARAAGSMRDIHAFGTPTVIHFCTALLISAVMTAPWHILASLGLCLGACGVAGVAYSFRTIWHARNATYHPPPEDWAWYIVVPLLGHMALICAAVLIRWNAAWSLVMIAADALAFLFLGVHNSWDTVTYIAIQHGKSADEQTKG
ncbi:MAG: hypothetical protein JO210_09455 [Acidobacteriaceae bacterium]|nr:hypothetical protein [Acidobacteriaceae bacterium]